MTKKTTLLNTGTTISPQQLDIIADGIRKGRGWGAGETPWHALRPDLRHWWRTEARQIITRAKIRVK